MKKIIEYNQETILVEVKLNFDHSDFSGMLHQVIMTIPSLGTESKEERRICDVDTLEDTINLLIEHGKKIIQATQNDRSLVEKLMKLGFIR